MLQENNFGQYCHECGKWVHPKCGLRKPGISGPNNWQVTHKECISDATKLPKQIQKPSKLDSILSF